MEPMVKSLSDMIYNQGILHGIYLLLAFFIIPTIFNYGIRIKTIPEIVLSYQKTHKNSFRRFNQKTLKRDIFYGDISFALGIFLYAFTFCVLLVSSFEFCIVILLPLPALRKNYKREINKFEKIIKPNFS